MKSPSSYAPTVSLPRATARRNVVLQAMLDSQALDRAQWEKARAAKVVLHDKLRADEPHGLYFKEQVRRELVDRFGWQRVYQGGLRVFTTIDMPMQVAAEAAIADQIKSIEERRLAGAPRRGSQEDGEGRGPSETGRRERRLCRRRSSRSNPTPATCARWSAAATSTRATSTGPFRRSGSPGRRSSRSCTRRRSRPGYSPATVIDHLDDPVSTAQGAWTPEDEHSSASSMTPADGAAHVEQSRGGAAAAAGRHRRARSNTRRTWASATCRACRRWRSAPARSRCRR